MRILNVTSLVDVMFILIIFFLLSTTFIEQPNIKLELPNAAHAEKSNVVPTVLVTLGSGGEVFVNAERVKNSELEGRLRSLVRRVAADKSLVLKADRRVPYGSVIFVMDTAKQAGYKKIVATTVTEEAKEQEKAK